MAVAALIITAERNLFVDFSKPYLDMGLDVLLAKEKSEADIFYFFKPFRYESNKVSVIPQVLARKNPSICFCWNFLPRNSMNDCILFSWKVWLCVMGGTILSGIIIALCSFLSPYGWRGRYIQRRRTNTRKEAHHRATKSILNYHNAGWFAIASVMQMVSPIFLFCHLICFFF